MNAYKIIHTITVLLILNVDKKLCMCNSKIHLSIGCPPHSPVTLQIQTDAHKKISETVDGKSFFPSTLIPHYYELNWPKCFLPFVIYQLVLCLIHNLCYGTPEVFKRGVQDLNRWKTQTFNWKQQQKTNKQLWIPFTTSTAQEEDILDWIIFFYKDFITRKIEARCIPFLMCFPPPLHKTHSWCHTPNTAAQAPARRFLQHSHPQA